MSHLNQPYPLITTTSPLTPVWTVCEPQPQDDLTVLLDLTDRISERLAKAEALTRLLTHKDAVQEYHPDAAWAIADLIGEARTLHARQWERIRRVVTVKT